MVVEQRDSLIDYPRGVGIDDESLRAFQAIGSDRGGAAAYQSESDHAFRQRQEAACSRRSRPRRQPFGWPRRSGFIQPLVDAELLNGLDRFDCVEVRWSSTLESFEPTDHGVSAIVVAADGSRATVDARYLIGCDGGRSTARRLMGTSFEGTTSSTRWMVIDLRTDPIGSPNVYVGADPARPFVSVSLAHGVRRFEFMLYDDESDDDVSKTRVPREASLAARSATRRTST